MLRQAPTRSPTGESTSAFWDSPRLLSKLTDKGTNWIKDSFKIFIVFLQKAEKAKFTKCNRAPRRKGVGWEEFRKRNFFKLVFFWKGAGIFHLYLQSLPPLLFFSFSSPHPFPQALKVYRTFICCQINIYYSCINKIISPKTLKARRCTIERDFQREPN